MYHSISDDPDKSAPAYYRVTTSPKRFRQQMQFLRDGQFEVLSLSKALTRIASGLGSPERSVVVTFDDGFEDFRRHAWPVLSMFRFTATVFLPTAFIGQTRRSFKGRNCLTWEEVRDLHQSGISFGAHTVNHPVLYGMPWTQIKTELRDARDQIENELQAPVQSFSYPYAFPQEDVTFVARLKAELLNSGYSCAVTTVIGRAQQGSHSLSLKRLPVNDSDDASLFASKLKGAYDWIGGFQSVVRRAKGQARGLRSVWNRLSARST